MFAFGGLLLVVILLWVWYIRSQGVERFRPAQALLTFSGAVIVLGSLILLPWIHSLDPASADRRVQELASEPRLQQVLGRVPKLCQFLHMRCPLTAENLREPFDKPDLQAIWQLVRQRRYVSGWVLWRKMPRIGNGLRWALFLSVSASAIGLIWSAISLIVELGLARKAVAGFYALVALLALLLLLSLVPSVDTLGVSNDLSIAWLALLAGLRTGCGIGWALLGLGLLIIGGGIDLISTDEAEDLAEPGETIYDWTYD